MVLALDLLFLRGASCLAFEPGLYMVPLHDTSELVLDLLCQHGRFKRREDFIDLAFGLKIKLLIRV
jgi:hypothetical protein